MTPVFLRPFAFSLFIAVLTAPAFAVTSEVITDASGKPMFELNYHDAGESWTFGSQAETSTWTIPKDFRSELRRAVSYWADIIGPHSSNSRPVSVIVGTYNAQNADASFLLNETEDGKIVYLPMEQLVNNRFRQPDSLQIRLGTLPWGLDNHPENLPHNGEKTALFPTMTHEIFHALGLISMANGESGQARFDAMENPYDKYLVDKNGVQAKPGMEIVMSEKDGAFVLDPTLPNDRTSLSDSQGHAYFRGKHVLDAIGNARLGYDKVNGVPVTGWECSFLGCSPDLSHVELDNSLMSHQTWRNYTSYMEAEMAILQDLGYTIDRKRYFGHSVYESGIVWESTHGYSARTADGTGWLENVYNDDAYGMGLHVYGDDNTLTQRHDILSSGVAAMGVRIDGQRNTLTITPGTRVHAIGDWSAGLTVAYGKGHHIIHQGDIAATGAGGIGIQLDFGDNVMGNTDEYRGSYMLTRGSDYRIIPVSADDPVLAYYKLDGPLVDTLDISGRVSGSLAAIKIAENAYVKTINIMRGADIKGDIVSEWNPDNEKLLADFKGQFYTGLNFGLAPKADGTSSGNADTSFSLNYDGNISGAKSLDVTLHGGLLTLNGLSNVRSFDNRANLVLTALPEANGSGISRSTFNNASQAAITTGTYSQSADASLETAFNASGQTAGISASQATLDGTWRLRPAADFYRDNTPVNVENPVNATTVSGNFRNVSIGEVASPTLQFSLTDTNPDAPAVKANRQADAYSRYADNTGAASVGRILPTISSIATGDMQHLFTALDFSAMNGSDIRDGLKQLTPGAYDTVARESLDNQHEQNMLSLSRLFVMGSQNACTDNPSDNTSGKTRCNDWTVSVHPFGRVSHLEPHGQKAGYTSAGGGITVQAEKTASNGLSLAFDASISDRRITSEGGYSAKTRTLGGYAGANALFKPAHWNGSYLVGIARLGIEDVELERRIAFNGYQRKHTGKWTGFTGSALAGVGKDWNTGNQEKNLAFGPLGWLEYAVATRGSLTESGEGASKLHVNSDTVNSFSSALGMHAAFTSRSAEGTLQWDALAAWRHQWQNETLHTTANFAGYGENGFTSTTDLTGKNSLLAQFGIKATDSKGRYGQLTAGSEWFGSKTASYYASVRIGMAF